MLEDSAPHGPQRPINCIIRPNVKAHPSKGKMVQKYLCALELANDTTVEDTVELRACGAGRNCYFFQKLCLALKMLVDDTSRWSTQRKRRAWLSGRPNCRSICLFFGRFVVSAVCHDGAAHRVESRCSQDLRIYSIVCCMRHLPKLTAELASELKP